MNIRFLTVVIFSVTLITGCKQVDDYMLGQDNTPKPRELKTIEPKIKVSQNWSAAVGKPRKTTEYLKLKPVIKRNIVYTADVAGLVQAVDKKTGKLEWSNDLHQGIVSGPKVANGYVALGTSTSSLVLLSQTDGKTLWEAKVSSEILSLPAIAQNKVVAKTIDGKVFAFDVANGKVIWTAEHGSPSLVLKASSSPVIVGNLVLIGFSDGKLDAYEIENGQLVWQRSIAYASGSSDVERLIDIDADPIVKDNVAYLGSYQGYIGALSLTDGQFLWRKAGSVYKNMMLHKDSLYLTDSNDVIWSLDSHSGKVNWKQTSLKARGLTEPVLVGNDLTVGDKSGLLHFIDSQNGELIGRQQLSGAVTISPNVAGRSLYVLTDNGVLNKLSVMNT